MSESPQREAETAAELREALIGFCLVALPNEVGFEKAGRLADRFEAAVRAESAAELAAVRAERDEAELMRDFTDFHLRQLSDQRGEAESANEAWELGKITAEEALRRTDAAIQSHKAVTLDEFRAEREARS
jgi:hypothetical protein